MLTKEYQVLCQKSREVYTKVEILDPYYRTIGEITGSVTEGDYDITDKVGVRRTSKITLVTKSDDDLLAKRNLLWINRRYRLYQGIKSNIDDEVVWFLIGTYVISDPKVDCNLKSHNVIEIEGLDFVALMDDTFGNGSKEAKIVVEPGGNLSEAIGKTLALNGDEVMRMTANIEPTKFTVPHKVERKQDDSLWDTLKELLEMYMNYEGFFDVHGKFNYRKCSNLFRDAVVWDFTQNDLILKLSEDFDYKNFRNQIDVYGRTDEKTAKTPEAHMPDEKAMTDIKNEYDNDQARIELRNRVYALQVAFTKAYDEYVSLMEKYYKTPFENYKKARLDYEQAIADKKPEDELQKKLDALNAASDVLQKEYKKIEAAGKANDDAREAYVKEKRKLDAIQDVNVEMGNDSDMLDLDEPMKRRLVIKEDKYFEYDHCRKRAEYEFDKHFNCARKIKIECVPIYPLDVNQLIYIKSDEHHINGKYSIDNISCDLGYKGKMRITCHKVYMPRFSIDTLSTPKKLQDVPGHAYVGGGSGSGDGGTGDSSDGGSDNGNMKMLTVDSKNRKYYALPPKRDVTSHGTYLGWNLFLQYFLTKSEEREILSLLDNTKYGPPSGNFGLSFRGRSLGWEIRRGGWKPSLWRDKNGGWGTPSGYLGKIKNVSSKAYFTYRDDGDVDSSYYTNFANGWSKHNLIRKKDAPDSALCEKYYLSEMRDYAGEKVFNEYDDVMSSINTNNTVFRKGNTLYLNVPGSPQYDWELFRDINRNWYGKNKDGEYQLAGIVLSKKVGWVGVKPTKETPPTPLSEIYNDKFEEFLKSWEGENG